MYFECLGQNIMNIVNYLQFVEPMKDQFLKIYSTMSGIIIIVLILWIINLVVGLIQRTYSTGKVIGSFYRNYVHRLIKASFYQVISKSF